MSSTVVGGLLSTTTCQWGGDVPDPDYLKIDLVATAYSVVWHGPNANGFLGSYRCFRGDERRPWNGAPKNELDLSHVAFAQVARLDGNPIMSTSMLGRELSDISADTVTMGSNHDNSADLSAIRHCTVTI
ncbi:hypothetical protein BO94DRAFT_580878 [Aspergillus sclerotioniger CBS 115572]|uniref:Uncharacterized protein n=1 Tax=Aspergillus sclerotioniger CBS 115572 TaxID=1450535 RepID=A0A317XAU2_9EURO|nr:hypothetical protein BO94DRAFT_580878 [Aspergillus sclerotioniger CBS 115572]PWY95716.1 hypothetical protein BO94DRAFT_580878 [Aspergillus sclerotioniger CBS 115572]